MMIKLASSSEETKQKYLEFVEINVCVAFRARANLRFQ